jgi:hypothetical protein
MQDSEQQNVRAFDQEALSQTFRESLKSKGR